MRKQRAIKLYLDNTFEEKKFPIDANKLKVGKEDKLGFEPACVFAERKPKSAFLRSPKKLLFFVDGGTNALKFGKATGELQMTWTKAEARELVNKSIAEAHTKFQPIKTYQFIIIVALLVIVLFFLWRIAGTTGALR